MDTHLKRPSVKTPPTGNTSGSSSVPCGNQVLFGVAAGSSSFDADLGHDQIQAQLSLVQMGCNISIPDASLGTTQFYNYTQSHGTGGHVTIQNFAEDPRNQSRTINRGSRPVCIYCNNDNFSRVQELERHVQEQHMPWRRCPFCDFLWARPGKIKNHIITEHAEKFTPEMLEGIKTFCGRRVVEFLNGYDHGFEETKLQSCP